MKGSLKKTRIILTLGGSLWTFCALFLICSNSDFARETRSLLQSGTQVYFDEGVFSNEGYHARVTAFDMGEMIRFGDTNAIAGSTLPEMDGTNDFPIVKSGAFIFRRGTHYGSVTNTVYDSPNTPALILNPGDSGFAAAQGLPVPTTNPNRSPYAGRNFGLKQASQVHVHTGRSSNQTGSASCLTIAPDRSLEFFSSKIGQSGVVHITR